METIINYIYQLITSNFNTIIHILIALGIIILFFIIGPFLTRYIIKLFKIQNDKIKTSSFYKPLKYFFTFLGIYLALLFLDLPTSITGVIHTVFRIGVIILFTIAFNNALKYSSNFMKKIFGKTSIGNNEHILKIISTILRTLLFCLTVLMITHELGYNISGLIAGLGLGGLTVALAAQDTAKNIFGGMVIFLDKPFQIGEWIETANYEGIVEEITFRTTRIRTWDDSVATIPNSMIADASLINWSKMSKRRIKMNLEVEFSTNLKQLSNFINDVKILLENHKDILTESIHVNFSEIANSGYKVEINCNTPLTSYYNYLNVKESINYKIVQLLAQHKISTAYPSTSVYVKK